MSYTIADAITVMIGPHVIATNAADAAITQIGKEIGMLHHPTSIGIDRRRASQRFSGECSEICTIGAAQFYRISSPVFCKIVLMAFADATNAAQFDDLIGHCRQRR